MVKVNIAKKSRGIKPNKNNIIRNKERDRDRYKYRDRDRDRDRY